MLLACRLGLRESDIVELQLNDINWETNQISVIQRKTKKNITLPLLQDVGWALIDYLKNGRPISESPYVFIRLIPPYSKFHQASSINVIFQKYIRAAGLSTPKEKNCGLHSFRHTLGRILLEKEISLPLISEILGHQSIKSTETYLKINLDGLFQCPLNPNEVFNDDPI